MTVTSTGSGRAIFIAEPSNTFYCQTIWYKQNLSSNYTTGHSQTSSEHSTSSTRNTRSTDKDERFTFVTFCSPVRKPLIIHSSSSFPHQRHLSSQNQTHNSLSHQQTDVPVRDPVRWVFGAHICVCWRGSERRGKGSGSRVGQQQRCQQQSPCSPTIPCTSVSTIYRSTVSSIHTAPASSPQRILFIVSRMQQLRCDSSSLGMCCFFLFVHNPSCFILPFNLHCVSLVIVLYTALCTVALAHCASYRLPPSLPSLSLSLSPLACSLSFRPLSL